MQPGRLFRLLLLGGALVGSPARAQAPAPVAADSLRRAAPAAMAADTLRPAAGVAPEAETDTDAKLTRPLAVRIAAAIVVLTLSTLLLYNVRSR